MGWTWWNTSRKTEMKIKKTKTGEIGDTRSACKAARCYDFFSEQKIILSEDHRSPTEDMI